MGIEKYVIPKGSVHPEIWEWLTEQVGLGGDRDVQTVFMVEGRTMNELADRIKENPLPKDRRLREFVIQKYWAQKGSVYA